MKKVYIVTEASYDSQAVAVFSSLKKATSWVKEENNQRKKDGASSEVNTEIWIVDKEIKHYRDR